MSKKAVFLDRDGIINYDKHYVYKISDFEFNKDIFELLNYLQEKDFELFIVTNQSGISRGYYTLEDFYKLTTYMLNKFKEKNIKIKDVAYCPHQPSDECECRKPKSKMVIDLKNKHDIDLSNSWFIGDKDSDIQCAINSGVANMIKVEKSIINPAKIKNNYFECKEINQIFSIIK